MKDKHRMNVVLKSIEKHLSALEEGTLNAEGLEEFVHQTRSLYEQAVILQYKAYEKQVFSSVASKHEAPSEPAVFEKEEISTLPTIESADLTTQSFHFEPEVTDFEATVITEKEPVVAFNNQPTLDFDFDGEQKAQEREELHAARLDRLSEHVQPEPLAFEQENVEIVAEVPTPTTPVHGGALLHNKFGVIDELFFKRIGHTRLSTLQQSFPLNDRMVYIRELFRGSGETFSDALKRLDSATGYSEALEVASGYAQDFDWNLESNTVEGFVTMIKRRHG